MVFTPGEGQLSIGLGSRVGRCGGQRGDRAVGVPPVLLGTAYGIWKENQLDREVWQVIDKALGASEL